MKPIFIDGNSLTLKTFSQIVSDRHPIALDPKAKEKMLQSRQVIENAVQSGERIYSINTGFGVLSSVTIEKKDLEQLQVNLIRSHASGVDENHTEKESRAMLLLRANVLAKGLSGVRPILVEHLIELLNKEIHPVIPTRGSVGASGDLAPLAHLALVLIGEGEAFCKGQKMSGKKALESIGLKPLTLAPKEGLSLINGTQQMTAISAMIATEAETLCDLADLTCTCSLEGVLGSPRPFQDWIQAARPHPGQIQSAKLMRHFMEDSLIRTSHLLCDRVQDPYSFRCSPQVHGACRDLIHFAKQTTTTELNSATDNPLVDGNTGALTSNGNFHGQPVAFALDILGMAISELGSISERRISKLIDPKFSELPAFLVKNEGLNSGFMMSQVTAASLVAENKLLTHPGSTDSIPTNNEKEDHVSMGPLCAVKAQRILKNTQYILAIEMLTACQALEFRKPLKPGVGPRAALSFVRKEIPPLETDRVLQPDIEKVTQWFRDGSLTRFLQKEGVL